MGIKDVVNVSCDYFYFKDILENIRKHIKDIALKVGYNEAQIITDYNKPRDDTKYFYCDKWLWDFRNQINGDAQQYSRSYQWKITFNIIASNINDEAIEKFFNLIGRDEMQNYNHPYEKTIYYYFINSIDLSNSYIEDRNRKVLISLEVYPYY